MLDGDNQGTAINQKFQLAPPRTHPPPPKQILWTPIWYVTLHFRDRHGAA